MNRRTFLQRGSFAAIAIAGLPKAVKARQNEETATYKSEDDLTADASIYALTLTHSALTNFKNASVEDRILSLGVRYYAGTSRESPTRYAAATYKIQKVKSLDKEGKRFDVTAGIEEKNKGDFQLPKRMNKKLEFICEPNRTVVLTGTKEKIELEYAPPTGDEDCFLTTACVKHRQLPDNCEELQTLRRLRDQHMRKTGEGLQLITTYGTVGPRIVAAIRRCENEPEILEYMYQNMILPSVALVQAGEHNKAITYYRSFVAALEKAYC